MGVHDVEATREAKKLLGIPEDEPVFILRAQDILYPAALACYGQLFTSAVRTQAAMKGEVPTVPTDDHWNFLEHVEACEDNGRRWQRRNAEKVKVPD